MTAIAEKRARLWERDEWAPIPSAPGYCANARGEILGIRGSVLSRCLPRDGYLQVTLHVAGRQISRDVHVLVCEAFHGSRPPFHQAAHNNGIRSDCRASNLRWATAKSNVADKVAHGTHPALEAHPRAQLTNEQVLALKAEAASLMGPRRLRYGARKALSTKYGVSIHIIKDILAGRTWRASPSYPTRLGWLRKEAT